MCAVLLLSVAASSHASPALQGTVTDRTTGQPLAGAKIYLHSSTNIPAAAVTDAAGFYTVDGNLFTNTSGPITFQALGHYAIATSYNITTVPTTLDVSLLASATPVVQGTVRDSVTAVAIANAFVFFTCNFVAVNGCNISATSDAAGAYAFDASQFFEAAATGFQGQLNVTASGYFAFHAPLSTYASFPVVQDVNLLPSIGTVLEGIITDRATGQPLAGAKVYLHSSTNIPAATVTDAAGVYTLDGSLFTNTSGPITFQALGHYAIATSYNITAVPTTLDVSLLGSATPVVQGNVRDSVTAVAIANAFVFFTCNFVAVNGCNISAASDAAGAYAFDASQFFETAATGFQGQLNASAGGHFTFHAPLSNYGPSYPVVHDVNLLPSIGTVLEGTITDRASGQPLAGAKVYLHSSTNIPVATVTDAAGVYTLDGSLFTNISGPITFQALGHYAIATSYNIVAVPATLDVSLLASATSVVQGTVRDSATALPVAHAFVFFACNFVAVNGCNISTFTDLSGGYAFDASQFFETAVTGFQGQLNASATAYFALHAPSSSYAPAYPAVQDLTLLWNGTVVSVTVDTNPPGLAIVADGTGFTAPHTFSWIPGSPHTVATTSPQNGAPGTRYTFVAWSDGGALSHVLAAPDNAGVVAAQFSTQHLLTTAVSPAGGGSITAGGWQNANTAVNITATPAAGFTFSGFSGDLSGAVTPQTLLMTGPKSVTANFTGGVNAPTITNVSPTSGGVGTLVTIDGTNFKGATTVSFNGASATFSLNGQTRIKATVPAGATTGPVTVTTPNGSATSVGPFTVVLPPTITSFTPTIGPSGTSVTIVGTNFTGATSVNFGKKSASFTVTSATQIVATVPPGAKPGPISVTTPGGSVTSVAIFQ